MSVRVHVPLAVEGQMCYHWHPAWPHQDTHFQLRGKEKYRVLSARSPSQNASTLSVPFEGVNSCVPACTAHLYFSPSMLEHVFAWQSDWQFDIYVRFQTLDI